MMREGESSVNDNAQYHQRGFALISKFRIFGRYAVFSVWRIMATEIFDILKAAGGS